MELRRIWTSKVRWVFLHIERSLFCIWGNGVPVCRRLEFIEPRDNEYTTHFTGVERRASNYMIII